MLFLDEIPQNLILTTRVILFVSTIEKENKS